MIFDKVNPLFWIRIRIQNLKLRILQKVSDPYGFGSGFGSGSTTLCGIPGKVLWHIRCDGRDMPTVASTIARIATVGELEAEL
jgi:hypothetical protein